MYKRLDKVAEPFHYAGELNRPFNTVIYKKCGYNQEWSFILFTNIKFDELFNVKIWIYVRLLFESMDI